MRDRERAEVSLSRDLGLFDQLLFGVIPRRVAEECPKTVIMVKRYQGRVRSWIRKVIIRE